MNAVVEIRQMERRLYRRVLAQSCCRWVVRCLLTAAGAWVALQCAGRWVPLPISPASLACFLGGAAVLLGALLTLLFRPTQAQVVAAIDLRAATCDRLATGLAFAAKERTSWEEQALQECARSLRGSSLEAAIPWQVPREACWLWVPLLPALLLSWQSRSLAFARVAEIKKATEIVAPTSQELRELGKVAEEQNNLAGSEDLKRLAEELKQSAERLNAEAAAGGDGERGRLRELSALEDMVRQMQESARQQLSAEELSALAEALKQREETREAGKKMSRGDLAGSAESLEKAAKELSQGGAERTVAEIQAALKEALSRLQQKKELTEAARQLAQQSQAGTPGNPMRRLADLLRKLPWQESGRNGQPATRMSAQALQKFLAALENMKQGQGKSGRTGQEKEDSSQVLLEALDRKLSQDLTGGEMMAPTGKAGGERDKGTTADPFGAKPQPTSEAALSTAIRGEEGGGESTSQQLAGATSDDSRAQRQYRELYQSMAPAAESAVEQENIPLGSRLFVRRYFKAIRPRE